jgi:hypothetical protein
MSWEQHRYAVERAARMRREIADRQNEAAQMVNLQGEANGSDAEMLDDVADFLKSLEGSKAGDGERQRFVDDWNKTITTLSNFCAYYDLPKPDMLFHPKWQHHMSAVAQRPIGSPLIYAGVRVRFGRFESCDVLRP